MQKDLDIRRRRTIWRASHRGTKELDVLLGGFAEAHVPTMDDASLDRFEQFLEQQDDDLQRWLLAPASTRMPLHGMNETIRQCADAVRRHHGLKA